MMGWDFGAGAEARQAAPAGELICLSGYLWKMKRHQQLATPAWNKRWFTVDGDFLNWFKAREDDAPSGRIPLLSITKVARFGAGQGGANSFTIKAEARSFLLRAASPGEARKWVGGITLQIDLRNGGTAQGPACKRNQRVRKQTGDNFDVMLGKVQKTLDELTALEHRAETPAASTTSGTATPPGDLGSVGSPIGGPRMSREEAAGQSRADATPAERARALLHALPHRNRVTRGSAVLEDAARDSGSASPTDFPGARRKAPRRAKHAKGAATPSRSASPADRPETRGSDSVSNAAEIVEFSDEDGEAGALRGSRWTGAQRSPRRKPSATHRSRQEAPPPRAARSHRGRDAAQIWHEGAGASFDSVEEVVVPASPRTSRRGARDPVSPSLSKPRSQQRRRSSRDGGSSRQPVVREYDDVRLSRNATHIRARVTPPSGAPPPWARADANRRPSGRSNQGSGRTSRNRTVIAVGDVAVSEVDDHDDDDDDDDAPAMYRTDVGRFRGDRRLPQAPRAWGAAK